jgi:plastocyanin
MLQQNWGRLATSSGRLGIAVFKLGGLCALWLAACCPGPAFAAQLVMHVADANGHAVSDAVITLVPDGTQAPSAVLSAPVTRYVDQRDETFIPYVQIFHPGDKVVFRNSDTTRHQVYSFSKIKKFELVLRPGESSPAMELGSTGIAAVGCNIHDDMVTYLFVTSVAHTTISNSNGVAQMGDLSPGEYTASIWHPQLHPGRPEPTRRVSISSGSGTPSLSFVLSLIPDPRGATVHDQPLY